MIRRHALKASAASLLLAVTMPALAAPSALVQCDGHGGLRLPEDPSVPRAQPVPGPAGHAGPAEASDPAARKSGAAGVAACTEALADIRAQANPVRRAELLLARAARQFEIGQLVAALGGARAARAVAVDVPSWLQPQFNRTVGASSLLTEAYVQLARNDQGEAERLAGHYQAEAERLAFQAAQARPFSLLMAEEAARVMALSPAISADEKIVLDRLWQIRPDLRLVVAQSGAGDWAGAAATIKTLIALSAAPSVVIRAHQAALQALAGDSNGAVATLARLAPEIDQLAAAASGSSEAGQRAALDVARADELVQLARAQVALNQGLPDVARNLLAGRTRWQSPASLTAQIIANAQARGGPGTAAGIDPARIRADAARAARDALGGPRIAPALVSALPRWEDPARAQALGGFLAIRNSSLQPRPARGGAASLVQSPSEAATDTVIEAMLLSAARAAAARGQDRFAVLASALRNQPGRPGLVATQGVLEFVTPADALFAAQAGRALKVADVEAALAARFRAPANPPR